MFAEAAVEIAYLSEMLDKKRDIKIIVVKIKETIAKQMVAVEEIRVIYAFD